MKQNNKLKVGDKVFIINRNMEIIEKKVIAIVQEENNIKYQLEKHQCGGEERTQIFMSKPEAESKKQTFLDSLNYKVGDLIVYEAREYHNTTQKLGRITEIVYSDYPYKITDYYNIGTYIDDEKILLKVKNEFIENFGNLNELYSEFNEKNKEINDICSMIHCEHYKLEKELKISITKQYSVFNFNKKAPKFGDRFTYKDDS